MKTVLIIDGDHNFCKKTESLMAPLKLKVLTAGSAADGREKTRNLHPDLIILSAELTDMSGYKLCKMLRSNSQHCKIILTSSRDGQKIFDRHSNLGYGADIYLSKPIPDQELLLKASKLLGSSEPFDGFKDAIDEMELEDWLQDDPEESPGPISSSKQDELSERLANQDRELEYLRKEVAAFHSFMKQAQKTEETLRDTRAQLATSETLLAELEKHQENPELSSYRSRISELEAQIQAFQSLEKSQDEGRRKLELENTKLQEDLRDARHELDLSVNSLDDMKNQVKKATRISEDHSFDSEKDQTQIRELEEQLRLLKSRLEESKSLTGNQDSELMEVRLELSALEEDKEALQNLLAEEQSKNEQYNTRVADLEKAVETLNSQTARIRQEKEQLERQLGEARSSVDQSEKQLVEQKDLTREKDARSENALQQSRKKVDELQDRVNSLELANDRNTNSLKEVQDRLGIRERELDRVQQNKQRLEIDLQETQQELSRLRETREQEARGQEHKLSELSKRANAAEEKLMSLEQELKVARRENQEIHGKISSKQAEADSLRTESERVRQDLEAERHVHQRLLQKSQEAENQFQADNAIFKTQKEELNSRIDSLNAQLKQIKIEHDAKLSEINQEHAAQNESLTAARVKLEHQIAADQSRIHELLDSIQTLEKRITAQDQLHQEKLQARQKISDQELERIRQDGVDDRNRIVEDFAKQREQLEKIIVNLESDKKDLNTEISRQEERFGAKEVELRKAQEKASQRIAELEHTREALTRSVQKEREAREIAESKTSMMEDRIQELNKTHERATAELRKLHQGQVEEQHHQILSYQSRIDQLEKSLEKFQELHSRFENVETENAGLKMGLQALKDRLDRVRKAMSYVVLEMDGKSSPNMNDKQN